MIRQTEKKSRPLLLRTIRDAKSNLLSAVLLCAVVFLPVSIYRALNTSPSPSLAYTFIMYILNLAGFLLAFEAAVYTKNLSKNINHFISTAALKMPQFFAVSLLQLLAGAPLFIGLFFILMAVSVGMSAWWLGLLGIIALVLASIISIRLSLASILVVDRDATSIAALRASYRLTNKNYWRTVWFFMIYFFVAVLFSTLIFIGVGLIPKIAQSNVAGGAAGGLLLSILAPIYAYYLAAIVAYYEKKNDA